MDRFCDDVHYVAGGVRLIDEFDGLGTSGAENDSTSRILLDDDLCDFYSIQPARKHHVEQCQIRAIRGSGCDGVVTGIRGHGLIPAESENLYEAISDRGLVINNKNTWGVRLHTEPLQ